MKKENKSKQSTLPRLIPSDRVFCLIERLSPLSVWWRVVVIYVTIYIIVGLAVKFRYPQGNYLAINDTSEMLNGFNVWVFFLPMIWLLYRWIPQEMLRIIDELSRNQFIGNGQDGSTPEDKLKKSFSHKFIYLGAWIGSVVSILIYALLLIPAQSESIGKPDFWFYTPTTSVVLLLIFLFSVYILFVMVFRLFSGLLSIAGCFKVSESVKKISPLHPDGCGGFASLGKFSKKLLLAGFAGVTWSLVYNYFPVLTGGSSVGPLVAIIYVAYFSVIPFFFIYPIWFPHKAMKRYKDSLLNEVSRELYVLEKEILSTGGLSNESELKTNVARCKELSELYETLEKQIPTWPITVVSLRNSVITALSPLVISVLPTAVDILKLIKTP